MLERYGHGGDTKTASAKYGLAPESFLDFSANINPLGPPPGLAEELGRRLGEMVRYPDPGHRAFKEKLSQRLGTCEEQLVIGNGAAEVLALALLALQPKLVGVVEPCFSEYTELARKFGAAVKSVKGQPKLHYKADPADILVLMGEVELLFLGQPNNPNGVQYEAGELIRFAEAAGRLDTYLIVDEAFLDFIPLDRRQSLLDRLENYSRVLLVRSLTKFYAIPGLRLGFGIGSPELTARLIEKQVTWSVNGLALAAGEYCLDESHAAYERETIRLIAGQRKYLSGALSSLGCAVYPGEANFLLAVLPRPFTARQLQDALGQRGVLIRSCAMYPGLTERHFRIAVKRAEDNTRLIRELEAVIKGNS